MNSTTNLAVISDPILTEQAIAAYLRLKADQGVSPAALDKYKTPLCHLLGWTAGQPLTPRLLRDWRQSLEAEGRSKATVQNYVKTVNSFLRSCGRQDLCIPKALYKDLTGRRFGWLTALEPTDQRKRADLLWRCTCQCGREVLVPTTLLVSGNTTSCGCRNTQILRHANRYVEGTNLRRSLEDKPKSARAASGYTGVQERRGKWFAYINYKGVRHNLGTYSTLEEAVKARARAKEAVMEDAARLYAETDDLFGEMPRRPAK